ncbi:hypothetical protein [Burkholderia territorii]|uniref:hypothetical protein n=1 Tax=Burkholderia territorii TaxID=1503055 RepID=UPI0012D882D7|nr:hypothetical protein [Burkholderia territorii]
MSTQIQPTNGSKRDRKLALVSGAVQAQAQAHSGISIGALVERIWTSPDEAREVFMGHAFQVYGKAKACEMGVCDLRATNPHQLLALRFNASRNGFDARTPAVLAYVAPSAANVTRLHQLRDGDEIHLHCTVRAFNLPRLPRLK